MSYSLLEPCWGGGLTQITEIMNGLLDIGNQFNHFFGAINCYFDLYFPVKKQPRSAHAPWITNEVLGGKNPHSPLRIT